jgi:hypothetical protein
VPDVLAMAWDLGTFVMTFDMTQHPKYMEKSSVTIRRKTLVQD